MQTLPDFSHDDALHAIERYKEIGLPAGFRPSHHYDVLHNGGRYPPPAIAALATARITGSVPPPSEVEGGAKTACFRLLRQAGLRVVPKLGVIPFRRGNKYSRADIAFYLGTQEDTTKGDWATGYHLHRDREAGIDGWWFLFPNVGSAGRTGHDYPNEWTTSGNLRWSGKTSSRLNQPQILSLLNETSPVLLFTREHDRDRFIYQGQVEPVTCRDGPPVEVVWRIVDLGAPKLEPDDATSDEAPTPTVDGRETVLREIRARRGQKGFRDALLRCYARRCAVSGCDIVALLEAAHIRPYRGLVGDNDPNNGLLLRCDLHTLFDLDLLGIEPESLVVRLHDSIRRPPYAALEGTALRRGTVVPCTESLRARWQRFTQAIQAARREAAMQDVFDWPGVPSAAEPAITAARIDPYED